MARPLDERQQAELTAFVNSLAELAGYTSHAEWARDAGYPAPNLTNLRNAKGAIDGYNLLRLIHAAARRAQLEPEVLALLAERVADQDDETSIQTRLDELAGLVAQALVLLRAQAQQRDHAGRRTQGSSSS